METLIDMSHGLEGHPDLSHATALFVPRRLYLPILYDTCSSSLKWPQGMGLDRKRIWQDQMDDPETPRIV